MIRKVFLIAGAALAGLVAGCKNGNDAPVAASPLRVHTVTAQLSEHPQWISLIGRTQGAREVDVVPQVSGRIVAQRYTDGGAVKAGQTLFEIDPAPYLAKYNDAKAERLKAENTLLQSERDAKREAELWKAKATSQKSYEDAQSALAIAKNALESAKALEKSAAIDLGYTKVTSPAAGNAERGALKVGAYVTAGQTVLTRVAQRQDLEVLFSPSSAQLDGAQITTANFIDVYDMKGRPVKAKINYVSPTVDEESATRLMRAAVSGDDALLPGDLVRIRLAVYNAMPGYRIPQKAVVQLPDGTYRVYVAENGHAKARTVELGSWDGTDWIVKKGLKDNERVIVDQMFKLRDGVAVEPLDAKAAAQTDAQTK